MQAMQPWPDERGHLALLQLLESLVKGVQFNASVVGSGSLGGHEQRLSRLGVKVDNRWIPSGQIKDNLCGTRSSHLFASRSEPIRSGRNGSCGWHPGRDNSSGRIT